MVWASLYKGLAPMYLKGICIVYNIMTVPGMDTGRTVLYPLLRVDSLWLR